MVQILSCVSDDGLQAVEAACRGTVDQGVHSAPFVINILAQRPDPVATSTNPHRAVPDPRTRGRLRLADDRIRRTSDLECTQISDLIGSLRLYGRLENRTRPAPTL